jgi:hypothetical protein
MRSCLTIASLVAGLCMIGMSAEGAEIQLAGIRLGQHAINLLDVWDQPDGIVVGEGPEVAAPTMAQMPGAAAGTPLVTAPGMGMDMLGMGAMGMPPMGPMGPMGPVAAQPGMEAMGGMGPFPGAGMGAMPPGMGPEMGAPGAMGAPGGMAMGAPGAAAAAAGPVSPFPIWAMPVWVTIEPGEVEWLYQRGPVVMGFVLDRDGYITCIAVAGYECNWARTALWQPHRYVKLGDSLKRVLYRYGYPDEVQTYSASGPGVAQSSITVSFGQVSRTYSRDCILRYTEKSNIAFTLHDFKVVRIHIWQQ